LSRQSLKGKGGLSRAGKNMVAINESPHIGLDLSKYVEWERRTKSPDEIAWDIAYFSREARKAPFAQRINAIVIGLDKFGELVKPESNLATDLATSEVFEWAKQTVPVISFSTDTNSTEDILNKMLPLVDFNPQSIMVWLSPKGEIYQEARINVYQTIEVNGQKYLFFWSMPSSNTDEECLTFYKNLLNYAAEEVSIAKDTEALRISPLPVQIPPGETLTDFLDKQIPLPEIWEEIASRKIIKDTITEFAAVRGLVLSEYDRIISRKTEYENLLVGARLEMAVKEMLNIELRSGAHGSLNQNALSELGTNHLLTTGRLFSEGANLSTRESVHCGACGEYAKGQKFAPGFKCTKRSQND